MKKLFNKRFLGYVALAVACVMLGSGLAMFRPTAEADTVVVTSPFTEAVNKVRDSVVGVSNYQMVRVSNSGSTGSNYSGMYDPFSFFGFGNYGNYGYGNYGYGNYGGSSQEPSSKEVEYATGSGVVVADGYVLTNYHVVEDASALKVTIAAVNAEDAQALDAVLVAKDETLDVAVLYVEGLNLPAVELGDSDTLQVGDWAICIGNPLSKKFAGTVTAGIVSGLDRNIDSDTITDKYGLKTTVTNSMIQVDAAINSGNSGGGMFNTLGQLMGIPTLKYSSSSYSTSASIEGIGMCIPINSAKAVIEEALKAEKPATEQKNDTNTNSADGTVNLTGKPRMGITAASLNSNSAVIRNGQLPMGVYVREVQDNSPAQYAGIEAGDIIVEMEGNVITGVAQMQQVVAAHNEGDVITIKVYRVNGGLSLEDNSQTIGEGQYIDLELTLAVVDDVVQ